MKLLEIIKVKKKTLSSKYSRHVGLFVLWKRKNNLVPSLRTKAAFSPAAL